MTQVLHLEALVQAGKGQLWASVVLNDVTDSVRQSSFDSLESSRESYRNWIIRQDSSCL
jgi:hypothetical protein